MERDEVDAIAARLGTLHEAVQPLSRDIAVCGDGRRTQRKSGLF